MPLRSSSSADSLPCRHALASEGIDRVKEIVTDLPSLAPQVLKAGGIDHSDWPMLLRAAIESLRGTAAATTLDKRRFIEAVLAYGVKVKAFKKWKFVGTEGQQDYRVDLPDGRAVGIEAKGCPDGNNVTIWERPGWADEFVIWCLCPESLVHQPGDGVWSGVSRLINKMTAEKKRVDALIFWDGRCGSKLRPCPKNHGVSGSLRAEATDIPAQPGKPDWLPPPCFFLFPTSWPKVSNNPKPRLHTLDTCRFAAAMLDIFNVPDSEKERYVHDARVGARGSSAGTQILLGITSRCWTDGKDRQVQTRWKPLKRE